MDALNIDIDRFDWNTNLHVVIVNGVITDRRLLGKNIQTNISARNARDYGWDKCQICGDIYILNRPKRSLELHNKSAIHRNALDNQKSSKRIVETEE